MIMKFIAIFVLIAAIMTAITAISTPAALAAKSSARPRIR
jgi:hypothetical protein